MELSWRSFCILFIFRLSFIFQISSFQTAPVVSKDPVLHNLDNISSDIVKVSVS